MVFGRDKSSRNYLPSMSPDRMRNQHRKAKFLRERAKDGMAWSKERFVLLKHCAFHSLVKRANRPTAEHCQRVERAMPRDGLRAHPHRDVQAQGERNDGGGEEDVKKIIQIFGEHKNTPSLLNSIIEGAQPLCLSSHSDLQYEVTWEQVPGD
jgi:hypothetical protein